MTVCLHCNQNTLISGYNYCCIGCEIAYKLIDKLDLLSYYKYCKEIYNTSPMKIEAFTNHVNYDEIIKEGKDHTFSANLYVEGIKCGSCIWLIENTLKSQPEVQSARVNLSTNRLHITWNKERSHLQQLVQVIQNLGYKLLPYEADEVEDATQLQQKFLLKCIAIAGFANIQLMMIVMGIWFASSSMGAITRQLLHLIGMVVAIPCIFYSGMPFFKSAYQAIKARRSNMDVPISLSIIFTTLISIQEYILNSAYTYFDSALMLIFALLVGRYFDQKSRNNAKQQLRNLLLKQPKFATLYKDGELLLLPISQIKIGDVLHVNPGENIPADGILLSSEASIDNSIITGETIPYQCSEGEVLYSGSINLTTAIKMRVSKMGDETVLSEILKLMETAEQGRSKFVKIADFVAAKYTVFVLIVSSFTLIYWLMQGIGFSKAALYAVSVLIITCPCALGLAVPVVQILASSKLLKDGILIKTADALERLAKIDTIIFDKTGTLTIGKPNLLNIDYIELTKMQIIASMAASSNHPLCKAIVNQYNNYSPLDLQITEHHGMGLETIINGKKARLGSAKWCNIPSHPLQEGISEVWFCMDDEDPTQLLFTDAIKLDAKLTIQLLQEKDYEIWIVSGDKNSVVEGVAESLMVENFKGEVYPQEKYEFLEYLARGGKKVMMIGDGMNDAAALRRAHASMSPTSALDIAQNAADVLFQQGLVSIVKTLEVAHYSNKLVKQNFVISLIYNFVSIPLACMGMVTPLLAAIAMSASSICVIANSMRIIKD